MSDYSDYTFVVTPKDSVYVYPKGADPTIIGNAVGWLAVEPNRGKFSSEDTWVDARHQNKGLATEMYRRLHAAGTSIVESPDLSALGRKLWDSFRRKGLAQGSEYLGPKYTTPTAEQVKPLIDVLRAKIAAGAAPPSGGTLLHPALRRPGAPE